MNVKINEKKALYFCERKCSQILIIFILCAAFQSTHLTASDVDIAAKVGTLGIGLDFTAPITKNIRGRLTINGFSYEYDGDLDDIEYNINLDLFTAGFILDWHPFGGIFRLSGGALYNGNEVEGKSYK